MTPPDIDFVTHFVPDPHALFEQLKTSVLWDERMRARKTASFGVPYDYSQISYPAVPMPEALEQLCPVIAQLLGFHPNNCLLNFYPDGQSSMGFHSDANEQLVAGTGVVVPMPEALEQLCPVIAQLLGFHPNNCLLNFYPDGQSSMGFHSDANEQLVAGTGVVVISLGHARSMLFKHKQSGVIHEYSLPSGSLLHMSDALQTQWLHAIPKAPGAGERISLSFRQLKEQ
ncbi:2OG-Fe(II) oxygenase [Pseudomonas sp. ABAC61]|nr:2OG-Fe(II) oxygenase [Pseudomonas sp. ABAC61]